MLYDFVAAHYHSVLIILLVTIAILWAIYIVGGEDNPLEWWHLLATKGKDGSYYLDGHKFTEQAVLLVASGTVIIMAIRDHVDSTIFIAYLAFGGGSSGFSAYLRSKQPREGKSP